MHTSCGCSTDATHNWLVLDFLCALGRRLPGCPRRRGDYNRLLSLCSLGFLDTVPLLHSIIHVESHLPLLAVCTHRNYSSRYISASNRLVQNVHILPTGRYLYSCEVWWWFIRRHHPHNGSSRCNCGWLCNAARGCNLVRRC